MTNNDRIPLTSEDLDFIESLFIEVNHSQIGDRLETKWAEIKQQILADAEKAKKWDKLNEKLPLKPVKESRGSRSGPIDNVCRKQVAFLRSCNFGAQDIIDLVQQNEFFKEENKTLKAIVGRVEKLLGVVKGWSPRDETEEFFIRRLEEILGQVEEDGKP